jgi:AcrR family transcriptional regulator
VDGLVSSTVKEGRRERRQRELRECIYQTARRLFLEHGFAATTVNQIAEAADIAPATFFNYFQSKSAILKDMTREVSARLEALVNEQLARDASTQDRISAFASRVAEEILRVQGLAYDVMIELMQAGVRSGDVTPHVQGVLPRFTTLIREGQRAGDVRRDRDAEFLAEIVIGALNTAITNWLGDREYPLADRLQQTASFMGEAISSRTDI